MPWPPPARVSKDSYLPNRCSIAVGDFKGCECLEAESRPLTTVLLLLGLGVLRRCRLPYDCSVGSRDFRDFYIEKTRGSHRLPRWKVEYDFTASREKS